MTDKQGYLAMYDFLVGLWEIRKDQFDHDFPGLLGDMTLLENGVPADAAQWYDWKECVPEAEITEAAAFDTMMCFLDNYRKRGEMEGAEITQVINIITASPETTREKWLACVKRVLAE